MTNASSDFPVTVKGRVAQVYGLSAYVDQGWMTSHYATRLVGVSGSTLHKWAKAGQVSYRQDEPDAPFRYLRAEMLAVLGMRENGGTLTIRVIRRHIARKLAPEVSAGDKSKQTRTAKSATGR